MDLEQPQVDFTEFFIRFKLRKPRLVCEDCEIKELFHKDQIREHQTKLDGFHGICLFLIGDIITFGLVCGP